MAHYSRLSRIVVDAPPASHDDELAFWQEALGVAFHPASFPEYHRGLLSDDESFGVLVQRLGDGAARVHLDIHTTDRAAEVARLVELGATVVEEAEPWTIMRDPAGLLFCVVPDAGLDASNAREWP